MKNTYKITISDAEGLLFSCTHIAERYTTNQVPDRVLEELGRKYAPCSIVCDCLTEGWRAERDFS